MALSVHELRDIAPGHGKPAQRTLATIFQTVRHVRLFGQSLLRIFFVMIAVASLGLVVLAIATSVINASDARKKPSSGDFVYDSDGRPRGPSRAAGGWWGGWLPSWTDGWFSKGAGAPEKVDTANRAFSLGGGRFDFELRGSEAHANGLTAGNVELPALADATAAPAGPPAPSASQPALSPGTTTQARALPQPATGGSSPPPPLEPRTVNSPASLQPAPAPQRLLPPDTAPHPSAPAQSRSVPEARPSAPAKTGAGASRALPDVREARSPPVPASRASREEIAASTALSAAQADFRTFDSARAAVAALAAKWPDIHARHDFDAKLALAAEIRSSALSERAAVDPARDEFAGAGLTEAAAAAVAQCLARVNGLTTVGIARKTVKVQPAIPAWVIAAAGPALPESAGNARTRTAEALDRCVAPLRQAGTALVTIETEPEARVLAKIRSTRDALIWTR